MHIIPLEIVEIRPVPAGLFSPRHPIAIQDINPPPPSGTARNATSSTRQQQQPAFIRLSIGRWLRRIAAVTLVAIALWWLALPIVFPMTNQAVVNARLVQIRAPIDGTPIFFPHDLGDRIEANETLASMVNPRADSSTLSHLKSRLGELSARQSSLSQELRQVTMCAATCRETCKSYKSNRVAFLQAVVKQSESALQIARVQFDNAEKDWNRINDLVSHSAVASAELDKASEIKAVTRERIDAEKAALSKAKVELEAAQKGVYVSLETPSFLARAEELDLKIHTLGNALRETEEHIEVVEKEVIREERRIESLSQGVATSPVRGIVWKRYGNLGQSTKQNEILYEIAESGSIFVEAQLNQRHMANVIPGSLATIILAGGQVRKGHVRSVNTLGPADIEPSFAVNLPNRDFKQVRVLIAFDNDPGDADLVGRHVRVLLSDPSPTLLQRTVSWIFAEVGD